MVDRRRPSPADELAQRDVGVARGCLGGCLLLFLGLAALVIALAVIGSVTGENSDGEGSSRENVIERQAADYRAMVDRYIACKNRSLRLEQDFEIFQRSLDMYQTNPTETNRNWYLLARKSVERQLEGC